MILSVSYNHPHDYHYHAAGQLSPWASSSCLRGGRLVNGQELSTSSSSSLSSSTISSLTKNNVHRDSEMVTIFLSGDVVGIDVQCPCVVHTIDHCDEELIEGKKEEVFISILHFKIGTLP